MNEVVFNYIFIIFSFLLCYLIGSVNSSIIICKIMTGDDIRNHGSGNAGATNALRTLGKGAGALVLIFDALKAVISICLSMIIITESRDIAVFVSGIGVVIGHNFPVWYSFKGGKGIVVSMVSMFFADYKIGIIVVIVSLLIMIISRYVSLGSVLGALLFVILSFVFKKDIFFISFAVIISLTAIIRHKGNIKRLIEGNENKLSFSKK